jgi:uncharacterized phage protein (TIGR02220 family)
MNKNRLEIDIPAWRADLNLRSCSPAARWLWMEMLMVMHQATPYGYLVVNGRRVIGTEQEVNQMDKQGCHLLSDILMVKQVDVVTLLSELEKRGVFSRTAEGVIYSRKMVRDAETRAKRTESGKKGGNPALVLQSHLVKQKDNHGSVPDNISLNNSNSTSVNTELEKEEKRSNGDILPVDFVSKIIDDLNKKMKAKPGAGFRSSSRKNKSLIVARWREGWDYLDFIHVNAVKVQEWMGGDMEKYLRPETLYGPKFEGYRNQKLKVSTTPTGANYDPNKF